MKENTVLTKKEVSTPANKSEAKIIAFLELELWLVKKNKGGLECHEKSCLVVRAFHAKTKFFARTPTVQRIFQSVCLSLGALGAGPKKPFVTKHKVLPNREY